MSLQRDEFEKAVDVLMSPHHYEFLLYCQKQIERNGHKEFFNGRKRAREALRLIESENLSVGVHSLNDALKVLEEAVRRLD